MLKIKSAQSQLGGPVSDRSLEGFRTELEQLMALAKGIMDENAKAEIQPLVRDFYFKMKEVLKRYYGQGTGYSQGYQPNPNPLGNNLDMSG